MTFCRTFHKSGSGNKTRVDPDKRYQHRYMTSQRACSHHRTFWHTILRFILYLIICLQQAIEVSCGRSQQPSGGVVFYDSKKSSGTKQILSSKAANHKNRETQKKWAKMRQRLQTMLGYETVARSEKTHVFRCREIKTMRLNLKKRLCTSPVAAGTRYQRHFKRLHRLLLLLFLFSRPNEALQYVCTSAFYSL